MNKYIEKLKELANEEFGQDVTQFIEWAEENRLITFEDAQKYVIKYEYTELTKQNPEASQRSKCDHLSIVHDRSDSFIYNIVRD